MPGLSNDNNVPITITTEGDDSGIAKVDNSFGAMVDNFSGGMKKISIATGVVAAGLTAYSKSSVNYLQGLVKDSKALATQTGMTTEKASELTAVLGRMGINSSSSSTAFRTLSKQIADARDNSAANALKTEDLNNKIGEARIKVNLLTAEMQKNGDASGAIRQKIASLTTDIKSYENGLKDTSNTLSKLGITTQDADGKSKSFDQILGQVADKFKGMPDGAEKTAAAVELFGRSGTGMIKFLNQGSDGIQKLEDQAKKLGITLTTQNIDTIAKYTKSQKDLADSTNALKIKVGELTAPVMTEFNKHLNDMLLTLVGTDSPFKNVIADVLAFGGPVLGAVSATTAFLANLGPTIELLGKLGTALKLEAGFAAINALMTTKIPALLTAITPIGAAWQGAFVVTGILADIALVTKAVQSVLGAWNDVNAASDSAKMAGEAQDQTHKTLLNLQKNGTADQKSRAAALLKKGYSSGGFTGNGGMDEIAGIVHKGEYVVPKSNVDQQSGLPKAGAIPTAQAGNSFTIQQLIIQAPNNSTLRSLVESIDNDSLLASKGLTMRQGL
jgi:hypothetical protein